MIYKIIDLKAVNKMGAIYVLVRFWETRRHMEDGKPPGLTEDFYMAMRDEDSRVVTEEEGGETYVTTESGKRRRVSAKLAEDPEDPFVRETVKRDVPAWIRRNIEARWKQAQDRGETGDKTWPKKTRPKLTATDPAGILERPDVQALKGEKVEPTGVSP